MNQIPRLLVSGPVSTMPAASTDNPLLATILAAARDPGFDVLKLEKLAGLYEAGLAAEAEACFIAALGEVQGQIKRIIADSENEQCRSRYASYEAIDIAIRDIYTSAGFSISFNEAVGSAGEGMMRMLAYVSHVAPGARRGFTRTYHIDVPCDGKGARGGDVMSKTHAHISGKTYGKRALVDMIFNLAIGRDDDGNAASARQQAQRAPLASRDTAPVTKAQLAELRALIKRKRARTRHVEMACKVGRLEDLTHRLFQQARAKLLAMDDPA